MSPCVCVICLCGGTVAALVAGYFILVNNEFECLEKCNEQAIDKVRFLLEPSQADNDASIDSEESSNKL